MVIVYAAIYFGFGALLHALIVGTTFDFSNAWTWGVLLGWPLVVWAGFMFFTLTVTAIAYLGLAILWLFGRLD